MLIRFEVSNFRSIHEAVELSLVAVDRDRPGVEEAVPGVWLVPVAGIYGANASGKSNVLAALLWLRDAVRSSLVEWDEGIPVEPFAFVSGRPAPTTFVLEVAAGDIRYEYVCEVEAESVRYEALYEYPKRKRRRVFERDGGKLIMNRELGEYAAVKTLMTPRSLALSLLRRFEPLDAVQAVTDTLATMRFSDQHSSSLRWWRAPTAALSLFADAPQEALFEAGQPTRSTLLRERAVALLRKADLGIEDVRVEETVAANARSSRELIFTHRSGSSRFELEFLRESLGTKTWLALLMPLLTVLESGGLLVVDELDASLHPTLTAEVLKLFRSETSNPRGAQLIFTTHDTNLMSGLNRDEVWLTEKLPDGSTRLGSLADFAGGRVRDSANLARSYLAGRFGGLPDVQPGELVRALAEG